jgi:phospholipase/lecithinase/hemolysin
VSRLEPIVDGAGISYLALDDAFAENGGEAVTFAGDEHWTARGHRVAADAIEAFLEEEGVLN